MSNEHSLPMSATTTPPPPASVRLTQSLWQGEYLWQHSAAFRALRLEQAAGWTSELLSSYYARLAANSKKSSSDGGSGRASLSTATASASLSRTGASNRGGTVYANHDVNDLSARYAHHADSVFGPLATALERRTGGTSTTTVDDSSVRDELLFLDIGAAPGGVTRFFTQIRNWKGVAVTLSEAEGGIPMAPAVMARCAATVMWNPAFRAQCEKNEEAAVASATGSSVLSASESDQHRRHERREMGIFDFVEASIFDEELVPKIVAAASNDLVTKRRPETTRDGGRGAASRQKNAAGATTEEFTAAVSAVGLFDFCNAGAVSDFGQRDAVSVGSSAATASASSLQGMNAEEEACGDGGGGVGETVAANATNALRPAVAPTTGGSMVVNGFSASEPAPHLTFLAPQLATALQLVKPGGTVVFVWGLLECSSFYLLLHFIQALGISNDIQLLPTMHAKKPPVYVALKNVTPVAEKIELLRRAMEQLPAAFWFLLPFPLTPSASDDGLESAAKESCASELLLATNILSIGEPVASGGDAVPSPNLAAGGDSATMALRRRFALAKAMHQRVAQQVEALMERRRIALQSVREAAERMERQHRQALAIASQLGFRRTRTGGSKPTAEGGVQGGSANVAAGQETLKRARPTEDTA